MEALLQPHGVTFDGIYYCPHAPETGCGCRKPATGLMERAALALGFNPGESVMIGDKEADMLLGRAVGAMTILVRTGKGAAHEERCRDSADHVVDDLAQAAEIMENLD
jgi:D-glycero-D-manno-heptose 1,7-bisphosphate phosphatase